MRTFARKVSADGYGCDIADRNRQKREGKGNRKKYKLKKFANLSGFGNEHDLAFR